jgi:conserved hypothetical protein
MHRIGISLYPEHSTPEADDAYMALASSYGFSRIFTCLLSVDKSPEETVAEFSQFMDRAHGYGFTVAVDTNPRVFQHLGATATDISVFAKMGVDIIRLDGHLGDRQDIALTRNPYGIAVEFNASQMLSLDLLIERGAYRRNMCVCHNFYPQRFSGLSEKRFIEFSEHYFGMGLTQAAFVTSQQDNTFGPWPVYDGLPTCEDDRTRSIDLQARHLLATGLIDDIMIGNCFASEEELAALAAVDTTKVTFKIEFDPDATEVEKNVLYQFNHVTRGDASEYYLRSSVPRMFEYSTSIPARERKNRQIKRGDVLVVNDNLSHYLGEVEVALRDFEDDGTRNVVGRIPEDELFLLDYVKPEFPFGFVRD